MVTAASSCSTPRPVPTSATGARTATSRTTSGRVLPSAQSRRRSAGKYRDGRVAGLPRAEIHLQGPVDNGPIGSAMRRRDILKAAAGATVATAFGQKRPADVVLRNGKIITLDRSSAIAQSIAIAGDRIVAVGPNAAMTAVTAPATRTIDLRGKTVIPGLIDSHAHMDREGLKNVFPSLGRVRSIRDVQDRVAELARQKAPGEWIVTMPIGDPPFYFDVPDNLAEKRWPTRKELDAAAPNHPVFIRPIWGFWRHSLPLVSIANSEALRRAGMTRDTVSPVPSLRIEKDAAGEPTGVLIENEMQPLAELLWFRQAFGFTRGDRARALPLSAQAYHRYGTTSVFEEHGVANEVLRAYKDAYRDGSLTMRSALAFSPNWKAMNGAALGPFI